MPKEVFVRLDDETHAQVKADAEAEGRSLSNFVGRIVQAHYNKPIKDQKRGRAKKQLPFKPGQMVAIPTHYDPNIVVKIMAIDGAWAMVRRPGAMPFVESVRELRPIQQETQQ